MEEILPPFQEIAMFSHMSKAESSGSGIKWVFIIIFALFFVTGLIRLAYHWIGDERPGSFQFAARADLNLLLKAEKAFFAQHGFYTTDLASLALEPKFVYYKFGFVQPGSVSAPIQRAGGKEGTHATEGPKSLNIDPSRKDLDALKAAKPQMELEYAKETRLAEIDFSKLNQFCSDCTATSDRFKAIAAANLDADPTLDLWTIDQDGQVVQLIDDLKQ
jgi:hypothetical protein